MMNAPFSSKAIATLNKPQDIAPVAQTFDVTILVLPGFSHLALHSYIEPFCLANHLSASPMFRWSVIGMVSGSIVGANGLSITVEGTVDDVAGKFLENSRTSQLAIIAGEPIEHQLTPALTNALRTISRRGVAISAIGTAPWLLAEAGLLAESRCTIHWSRLAAFSEVFRKPRLRDSLFVRDGQYTTCAGELAAFDLAVDLIATHAGGYVAMEVCRHVTVEGQRSGSHRQTGPSGLAFAGVSESLVAAMRIMEENIECPVSMHELASRIALSRRQVERLFSVNVGLTPAKYYLKVRVDHARRLIEGTRLPLIDIAIASGFISASHFSKVFRGTHGVTPQQLRLGMPSWVGRGIG